MFSLIHSFFEWKNNSRCFEFQLCIQNGDIQAVKNYISEGIDINCKTQHMGQTPLDSAVISGKYEMYKLLIDSGADKNIRNNYSQNGLHVAAYCGDLEMFKKLEPDYDLEERTVLGGTPMHLGAMYGKVNIVKYLTGKLDHNQVNYNNETPLDLCVRHSGDRETIDYLVGIDAKSGGNTYNKIINWFYIKK